MGETFAAALSKTWTTVIQQAASFLPKLIIGIAILAAGFLVARLLRGLFARFFVAIRLDLLSDRMGISAFLARGDVRHTIAEILATVIYWIVLLLFVQLLGLTLGLEGLMNFISEILAYLPRLVIALAITLVGIAIGYFFGGAVQVAASNARFPAAQALGASVKYLITFFALVTALEQLEIATHLLEAALQIVIAAVAFGLALAFGLGCKDLAREAVQRWIGNSDNQSTAAKPDYKGDRE